MEVDEFGTKIVRQGAGGLPSSLTGFSSTAASAPDDAFTGFEDAEKTLPGPAPVPKQTSVVNASPDDAVNKAVELALSGSLISVFPTQKDVNVEVKSGQVFKSFPGQQKAR